MLTVKLSYVLKDTFFLFYFLLLLFFFSSFSFFSFFPSLALSAVIKRTRTISSFFCVNSGGLTFPYVRTKIRRHRRNEMVCYVASNLIKVAKTHQQPKKLSPARVRCTKGAKKRELLLTNKKSGPNYMLQPTNQRQSKSRNG